MGVAPNVPLVRVMPELKQLITRLSSLSVKHMDSETYKICLIWCTFYALIYAFHFLTESWMPLNLDKHWGWRFLTHHYPWIAVFPYFFQYFQGILNPYDSLELHFIMEVHIFFFTEYNIFNSRIFSKDCNNSFWTCLQFHQ